MTEIATSPPAADAADAAGPALTGPEEPRAWVAADVMSSPVASIDASTRLISAWTALYQSGRRHLVVLDERRCVGVVDDRRIGLEWPMGELRATKLTVGDILRRDIAVVRPEAPVADVARRMLVDGTDAVPVVSASGELVGLVTGSDLLALMAYGRPRRAGAE